MEANSGSKPVPLQFHVSSCHCGAMERELIAKQQGELEEIFSEVAQSAKGSLPFNEEA